MARDSYPVWLMPGILIGAIVGALVGFFYPAVMLNLGWLGNIFALGVQLIALPLLAATIVISFSKLGEWQRLGGLIGKLALFVVATAGLASVAALALVLTFRPGLGGAVLPDLTAASGAFSTYLGPFQPPVPDSVATTIFEADLFWILVTLALLAFGMFRLNSRQKTLYNLAVEVQQITIAILRAVAIVAPIGVFALIGAAVAGNRTSLFFLGDIGSYVLTVLVGFAVLALIIYPLALVLFAGGSPFAQLSRLGPAASVAFATSSSATAAPFTFQALNDSDAIRPYASGTILPLAITVNVAATLLYLIAAASFAALASGTPLTLAHWAVIIGGGFVLSFGLSGLPTAAIAVAPVLLTTAGFPIEGLAVVPILLATDWLLDRFRAVVNVWGDAVACAVLNDAREFSRPASRERTTRPERLEGRSRLVGDAPRSEPTRERSGSARPPRSRGDRPERRSSDRSRDREALPRRDRDRDRDRDRHTDASPAESPFAISEESAPSLDIVTGLPQSTSTDQGERNRSSSAGRERDSRDRRTGRGPRRTESAETRRRDRSDDSPRRSERSAPPTGTPGPDLDKIAVATNFMRSSEASPETESEVKPLLVEGPPDVPPASVDQPTPVSHRETDAPARTAEPEAPIASEPRVSEDAEVPTDDDAPVTAADDVKSSSSRAFGRSRARRGAALRQSDGDKSNTESATATETRSDDFTTEGASFGRGKRRK